MIDTVFIPVRDAAGRMRRLREMALRAVPQRGLALAFLGVALVLSVGGWVRPVLSRDISAFHLPLGIGGGPVADPVTLLHGPRTVPPDSVGVILAGLIGLAALVVLVLPRHLGKAAGVLLAAGLTANVAVAVNHPALIELLDYEYEQRQQMARTLNMTDEDVMTVPTNSRVGLRAAPVGNQQRGDLERGWLYLLHGRWLVLWAAGGVLLAGAGPLRRRLAALAGWGLLGVALVVGACGPRLLAEYHWLEAQRLEAECRFAEARQSLARAIDRVPQLERLERTWLLAGKLDYQLGQSSAPERFFRAFQLARDKELPRGVTFGQDLPWVIIGVPDSRSGLMPPPSGFNLTFADGGNRPGVPDFGERLSLPRGMYHWGYLAARDRESREALELLEQMLPGTQDNVAVRAQAARLWTEWGLANYWRPVTFTDSHPWIDRSHRERALPAAREAWLRAAALDPDRRDCALYLGIAQRRMNPRSPALAEAAFAPALDGLADQVMRAEILNTLADCYLHAGRMTEARRLYALSYDVFCLPKYINIRAQGRLGGL